MDLAEAKARVIAEKNKVTGSLSAVVGSRVLMAVLATLVIAFAANLLYSPAELPRVGGLSLAAAGLPPSVDFGVVGEQAGQAAAAAQREGARGFVENFLNERPQLIPILNWVGLGLSFALLMVNMTVMTQRRRISRG
ncbi:hypothetical protein U91I_00117 [alpha proteobacterium U9-1i]|nr:hypothetical protein U91I_00117 [alpha proteobacterium U9-1i]